MVKSASAAPERGDVVWITLDPHVGHEPSGRRPAVVLSPGSYNSKVGLAIFCPITNQIKGFPFETGIPEGLPVTGVILADEAKSLDWRARNAVKICSLPLETVVSVLKSLSLLLNVPAKNSDSTPRFS